MANVGDLNVKISADASELRKGIEQAQNSLNGFAKSAKTVATAAVTYLAYKGVQALTGAITESVKVYNQFTSANLGLKNILEAQGKSFNAAKEFVNSYVSDGLIPLSDAVTAYKSLTARGYNDEQIKNTLSRLKDAAAFGRQSSLSIGEAVKSAAEGLKNENSILVDNAGVTKNVSIMWAEYARQIGVGEKSLTQAQKIQAEVNGIMKETQFQVGDAAKYAGTLAGQMAALSAQTMYLKNAFGAALEPILRAIIPVITDLVVWTTNAINSIAQFARVLFGANSDQAQNAQGALKAATAQTAFGDAIKEAGKKAKMGVAAFDEVNELQKNIDTNATDAAGSVSTTKEEKKDDSSGSLSTGMSELAEKIREYLKPAVEGLSKAWKELMESASKLWEKIKPFLEPIKEIIFDKLKTSGEGCLQALKGLLEVLTGIIEVLDGLISGDYEKVLDGIKTTLKGMGDIALGGLKIAFPDVGKAVGEFVGSINKSWEDYKKNNPDTYNLGGWIKSLWDNSTLGSWISSAWSGFVETLSTLWTNFKSMFSSDSENSIFNIAKWIKYLWESSTLGSWISSAWSGFVEILKTLWSDFKTKFAATSGNSIFNLSNWIKYLWTSSAIGQWISDAWNALVAKLNEIWNSFKTSFPKIFNIADWIKEMWDKNGKSFLNAIIADINSLIAKVNGFKITIGGASIGANIPPIQPLATGGIVTSPTLAMIGEAGTEAVVPLGNSSFTDDLAGKIVSGMMQAMQFNNNNQATHQSVEAAFYLDGSKFAQAIKPLLETESLRVGKSMIIKPT